MTEDHIGDSRLSRTWEGTVDGPTFERFAQAWRLPAPSSVPPSRAADPGRGPASQRFTLDGMNWEDRGEAPIVCVSLEVTPVPASERGS